MNAKVNEVLSDTRRIIKEMKEEINTDDSLRSIERQVKDAVNWFRIYLDYIACFNAAGMISDEEHEYLVRNAYEEFYK